MTTKSLEEMRATSLHERLPAADWSSPPPRKEEPLPEDQRHHQRAMVREEIATAQAKRQRAAILARRVAQIDSEADAAADLHQQQVAPLRARLDEIEIEQTNLLARRLPVPPELIDEQADLLAQVEGAGETLKGIIDAAKAKRRPLAIEIQKLRLQSGTQHLYNRLTQQPLANPLLFDQQWALRKLVTLIGDIVTRIRKRERTLGSNHLGHPRRYDFAVERAERFLAELERELEDIRQQMVDE